jgi:hypothetical protein
LQDTVFVVPVNFDLADKPPRIAPNDTTARNETDALLARHGLAPASAKWPRPKRREKHLKRALNMAAPRVKIPGLARQHETVKPHVSVDAAAPIE